MSGSQAAVPNVMPASMEVSPLRSVVSSSPEPQGRKVYTRELHNQFLNACGNCHAVQHNMWPASRPVPVPAYLVDGDFAELLMNEREMIAGAIHEDHDKDKVMPPLDAPGGKFWSDRKEPDKITELDAMFEAWFDAGAPPESFYLPPPPNAVTQYSLPEDIALHMTNLGTSIPSPSSMASATGEMDKLDAMFAAAKTLPATLSETDLVSLDSNVLARTGVVSFAPAYPLFSDEAHKNRYIRVPRGKSVVFDKASQTFNIPPNTRFYKTFLKAVKDGDATRYRKIETRIIVSRPAEKLSDGTVEPRALYGTYAWDENETQAYLVTDRLRDGEPFLDRLLVYATDEAKERELKDQNVVGVDNALLEQGAGRTYAIPGSVRCVQCHRGSVSFALGFTPLQIRRRPTGQGGTYEPAGPDELSQLQRLIDYKVITGITSEDDVLPLERSQGACSPRNEYELKAQGYMLGNCANCHNPIGFPTLKNPILRELLNFLPDQNGGGIFQFPLERTSPRIKRGALNDQLIPYITPSLLDYDSRLTHKSSKEDYDIVNEIPKAYPSCGVGDKLYQPFIAAPWRSLIYRNVDSPYLYFDDFAAYPHMPMNAVGYDERVRRILGDWMVSIPARLSKDFATSSTDHYPESDSPGQPYEEVKPSDPDYHNALAKAQQRLDLYHSGGPVPSDMHPRPLPVDAKVIPYFAATRYSLNVVDTSDIVDPAIPTKVQTGDLSPNDTGSLAGWVAQLTASGQVPPADSFEACLAPVLDGVPDRPNWVVTDFTDWPGDWVPRRVDWQDALLHKIVAPPVGLVSTTDVALQPWQQEAIDHERQVIEMLQTITLSDAKRKFLSTKVPFGVWQAKQGCDFSQQKRAADFPADQRPHWMDESHVQDSDPIYAWSPGEMVFNEICVNCHGPKFDSDGRMADFLIQATGGTTRVANLRDGMFGPTHDPSAYRRKVFSLVPRVDGVAEASVDDWSARYMAWMALGGTRSLLDEKILSFVSTAQVLGQVRKSLKGGETLAARDANMLAIARTLCGQTLTLKAIFKPETGSPDWSLTENLPLVGSNGDAETWMRLCAYENPPPVRIITYGPPEDKAPAAFHVAAVKRADGYGNAAVADERGNRRIGISSDNVQPWCFMMPTDPNKVAPGTTSPEAQKIAELAARGAVVPPCPVAWRPADLANFSEAEDWVFTWKTRGAINAGFGVFTYLDAVSKSHGAVQPSYDACEQLAAQK